MRITLLGMPASGKSTWGKILAQKLNYQFIDVDTLIVENEGLSIPQIFQMYNEEYFRKAERKALQMALNQSNTIIATGGGAPCFFDNIDLIRRQSMSIYLKISIEKIAQRIQADNHNERPLYDGQSLEELIKKLQIIYEKRKVYYEKAQLIWEF